MLRWILISFIFTAIVCSLQCLDTKQPSYYQLKLNNGKTYIGVIEETCPDGSIKFRTSYDKSSNIVVLQKDIVELTPIVPSQIYEPPKYGSIGVGFGYPYGALGFNSDLYLSHNIALTSGVGSFPFTPETGYSLGLRYYPWGLKNLWSPKISVLYGTNRRLQQNDSDLLPEDHLAHGLSLEIGQQLILGWKKISGIDVSVIIPIHSNIDELEKKYTDAYHTYTNDGPVSFVLAYQRHF